MRLVGRCHQRTAGGARRAVKRETRRALAVKAPAAPPEWEQEGRAACRGVLGAAAARPPRRAAAGRPPRPNRLGGAPAPAHSSAARAGAPPSSCAFTARVAAAAAAAAAAVAVAAAPTAAAPPWLMSSAPDELLLRPPVPPPAHQRIARMASSVWAAAVAAAGNSEVKRLLGLPAEGAACVRTPHHCARPRQRPTAPSRDRPHTGCHAEGSSLSKQSVAAAALPPEAAWLFMGSLQEGAAEPPRAATPPRACPSTSPAKHPVLCSRAPAAAAQASPSPCRRP